jgi:hypothetical protein
MMGKQVNRGVKFVSDFVNDDGSFLNLDQFSNKFGFCVNFLQYNGVNSSLPQMLKLYPYNLKNFQEIISSQNIVVYSKLKLM